MIKRHIRPLVNILRAAGTAGSACVITTFKDKFEMMEFFVNYYSRYWKIKKFVFAMGYTDTRYASDIKSRIARITGSAPLQQVAIADIPHADMTQIAYEQSGRGRQRGGRCHRFVIVPASAFCPGAKI